MGVSDYLSSLFGLEGKTALVTGGTRGIGRQIAFALAQAGADIILLVRDPSSVEVLNVVVQVESLGRECHTYICDLSRRPEVLSIVPHLARDQREVDIFIHCAGLQHRSPAEDFPDADWDMILDVNLTAGFQLSRDLAKYWFATSLCDYANATPQLKLDTNKKVLFVASLMSFTGGVEIPAYTASKGAIAQLTKALNNEWMEKGINVNALAPGYIQTELTSALKDGHDKERKIMERVPAGRWGQPYDLEGAVIYLTSRAADFVGGEILAVDGGFLAR
ncbi:2-deoxy-D-gluconate 3-dehydrogenase [Phlyctema vagabunda]|uniref:2-deoxy-D-gluconate 3-dehydrogenase n=1 Tax=Phlyctema vagabunda TaxID=108571 RepID=A0ABR4P5X7_9HELO